MGSLAEQFAIKAKNVIGKKTTEAILDKLNLVAIEMVQRYDGTKNYNQYLAYTLDSDYGAESGEFGRSRFLKPSEQEKYKELFSEVIPEDLIDPSLFKYVDYCYYNCCEADDYYVKKDSFEEEI